MSCVYNLNCQLHITYSTQKYFWILFFKGGLAIIVCSYFLQHPIYRPAELVAYCSFRIKRVEFPLKIRKQGIEN